MDLAELGIAIVMRTLVLALAGVLLLLGPALAETLPVIPDDSLTPGVVASTDQKLVCATGAQGTYSQQHRVTTTAMKAEVYRRYHVEKKGREFEIDHRLPLALGGKDAIENLWPQEGWAHPSFHDKDRLEAYLWRQVCRKHAMALGEAQKMLLGDWRPAYKQVFGEAP
jgi:hypothetical protein